MGRDAAGLPDGLLTEQAQGLANRVLRPVSHEDYIRGLALASRVAAAEG